MNQSLINPVSNYAVWNPISADPALISTVASCSTPSSEDFTQLFAMIMGMNLLSLSGSSSSTQGDSLAGMGNLMAPMLAGLMEKLLQLQVESGDETPSTLGLASAGAAASLSPYGMPVNGPLTQSFHSGHNGLDFGVPVGTPVQATMSGQVVYAGWNDQGYGNLVIVENGNFRTYYAHLSEIPVEVGQWIDRGSVIGLSGSTGNSTGPHLHYEVRLNGSPIDPTSFTLV